MIHDTSCPCYLGGTDLFSTPPSQTAVLKRSKLDFHPIANLSDAGPIEFLISACDEEYYDLSSHCIQLRLKIVKQDGTDIAAEDKVGLVNFPLHSLFSQIDMYINDELISNSSYTFPYKPYLEKILSYEKDVKKSCSLQNCILKIQLARWMP